MSPTPTPPTFQAHLVEARSLSSHVRELTFAREDGLVFDFDAGQWVNVVLPLPSGPLRRAYSIASPPGGDSRFQIAVTRVEGGPGSTCLHELPLGATITVVGPQGFFKRPPDATYPSLFVATGTGITPLRSMIKAALSAGSRARMHLVVGARTEADRIYVDELEALAKRHPNLHASYTLSRADEAWTGPRGYVQAHVPDLWRELRALGEGEPHAFVCGLQRMVGAVREVLKKDLGVVRQQVHSERYD